MYTVIVTVCCRAFLFHNLGSISTARSSARASRDKHAGQIGRCYLIEIKMPSLKNLFRTAAKATHPDHGGDPEAFKAVKGLYDAACRAEALGHQSAFTEDEHASTAHESPRASTRQAREQSERNTDRYNQNSDYYDNLARQEGAQNHSGFRAWCKWHHRSTKDGRAWAEYKQARADEAANAPRQTGAGCTVRSRNSNQSSGASVDWPNGSAGVDQSSFMEWYQANHEVDETGTL